MSTEAFDENGINVNVAKRIITDAPKKPSNLPLLNNKQGPIGAALMVLIAMDERPTSKQKDDLYEWASKNQKLLGFDIQELRVPDAKEVELKINLQINTDEKITVIGRISCDPMIDLPISVEISSKLKKKEGDISHYDCVVSFSRKLNEEELQSLELAIVPDTGFSDPLGSGECFTEVKWIDLKDPIWKVNLHTGMVNLPFEAKKDERIYCEINSGNGYYRRTFTHMIEDNKCFVRWRASSGESTIRLIKEENFMNSIQHEAQANWSSWSFDPTKAEDVEFKLIQK